MKLNEIIELNGKEYTVELNRESMLRIDKYVNLQESFKKIVANPIVDKSLVDLPDDENPFGEIIDEDEIRKVNEERIKAIEKVYIRAFWIWLYPVEKLSLAEVSKILRPYLDDEEKSEYLANKYNEFATKSTDIREKYLEEQKNLKAQVK